MTRWLGALLLVLFNAASLSGQAHVLIVSGLGGEPQYVNDFHAWGTAMVDAARERFGLPAANVVYLSEDPSRDPERVDGISRREDVEEAIRSMAARADEDDRVLIVLIGHGSADSRGSRINLPGPDITAEELAELLEAFGSRPLVVVNTASASGDYVEALMAPNRTIITATRSGRERNETIFGRYFVEAFSGEGADANRDGRVTVMEAYEYAVRETRRAYETDNRLQMENARIEGDLELAGVFHLGTPGAAVPDDASPELRALYAERERLEESIDALRARRGQMDADEYQRELERLLLELARTNQRIEQSDGGG